MANIMAEDSVCDPMCGVGTLLIEAAKEWPRASYLGMDVSDNQLQLFQNNLVSAGLSSALQLLKSDIKSEFHFY